MSSTSYFVRPIKQLTSEFLFNPYFIHKSEDKSWKAGFQMIIKFIIINEISNHAYPVDAQSTYEWFSYNIRPGIGVPLEISSYCCWYMMFPGYRICMYCKRFFVQQPDRHESNDKRIIYNLLIFFKKKRFFLIDHLQKRILKIDRWKMFYYILL